MKLLSNYKNHMPNPELNVQIVDGTVFIDGREMGQVRRFPDGRVQESETGVGLRQPMTQEEKEQFERFKQEFGVK